MVFVYIALITLIILLFMRKMKKGAVLLFVTLFFITIGSFLSGRLPVALAMENLKDWFYKEEDLQEIKPEDIFMVKIQSEVLIDAPVIPQFPELPRGCEVTSLAMLLQHAGVSVDKMTLAEEVKKTNEPYKKENGKIYYGHPNDGFVGDMYTYEKRGLGVYHTPIKELAEQYLPGQILDITGSDFSSIKTHLSDERPVWVIINTAYKELPDSFFQTWHTPSGEVDITFKEHSVLVTGYDEEFIYFNDPYSGLKNKKAPIKDFEAGWVQMGSQAITYMN
ncbi:uncharacterized protein YvpB [Cytobacillus horneckiae]|nr:C39 family peptidase [Cytobacillus horneckiae]MCM3179477.1 C39 family peptidase [Cytobacillus horneckiae]MEC1154903.1 C39 family peptidase [Cytobacillus horneckiae]MED2936191.1 C39 family peptidase [Cytobacillus horneckiae]